MQSKVSGRTEGGGGFRRPRSPSGVGARRGTAVAGPWRSSEDGVVLWQLGGGLGEGKLRAEEVGVTR